jgi:cyclopropane fatty-acyl-phospholipid synthase-like methyltransferase
MMLVVGPILTNSSALHENLRSPSNGLLGLIASTIMKRTNKSSSEDAWIRLDVEGLDTILEIGGGNGDGLKFVANYRPKRLVTVEISERLRSVLSDLQIPKLEIYGTDAKDMSAFLVRNSVDKLLAMNVVYFLEPLEDYAKEIKRVLKKRSGRAILGMKPQLKPVDVAGVKAVFEKVGFQVREEMVDLGSHTANYVALYLQH